MEKINEITESLKKIKFTRSSRRKSINNNKPPLSMIMGFRKWYGDFGLSAASKKYPLVYEKLKELMKEFDPEFEFTTITLNKNFKCEPHKDGKNIGDSYIIGLGDYDDGELNIEGEKINIKNKFYKFNGSEKTHFVEDWKNGDRFTLVFYKREKW
ncbi:MAG: hypothetical protein ACOYLT_05470 [Flavobacterium sp.]|uniref:hypothetical protein n=1 Tax=Flavobacterium sp. TaxID=239 RepID=UPI003BC112A6